MTFKSPLRGIQAMRKRHAALYGGGLYYQKVLRLNPIAYWPLWEASGTSAQCVVNPAQNGTYSSDVSGWPVGTGIGDGNTAPQFDGTNDYVGIHTAALEAGFDGGENTVMAWAKVSGIGVWTDGVDRIAVHLWADDQNQQQFIKPSSNNWLQWLRWGNNVLDGYSYTTMTDVDWMHLAVTISETDDEMKSYLNGVQQGTTSDTLGAWTGALAALGTTIGAGATTPSNLWSGQVAHVAVWSRILAADEILTLAQK